jgi:purine-binding chemotaxis protein CheW
MSATNQYLAFRLGDELYAIDVANAREIVEQSTITRLPKTPAWMRGLINLRGNVLPVLDLKMKLGMGATNETVDTCTIVVEVTLDGELYVVGVLADSVSEVFELDEKQVEAPPRFGTRLSTDFIKGMGRVGQNLIIVLDAERVFSGDRENLAPTETANAETVEQAADAN